MAAYPWEISAAGHKVLVEDSRPVSYHAGNVGGLDNRKGHAGNFFLLHEVVNQLVHGLPKVLYPGISAALGRELDGCRFLSGHFGGDVICMCGKAAQHARACENPSC